MSSYVALKNFFKSVPIPVDRPFVVSSDVLKLACVCRDNREKFDANLVIDQLLDRAGSSATLLLPTFDFRFCQGKTFNRRGTSSQTGGLGRTALERDGFRRTTHPMYSFAVAGKDRDKLCAIDEKEPFGKNSIFQYLYDESAQNIYIGKNYRDATTIVHLAETWAEVDFRYMKEFTGNYIDEDGTQSTRTYSIFVRGEVNGRTVTQTFIDPKTDDALRARDLLSEFTVNDVGIQIVNLRGAVDVFYNDLSGSQKLIYPLLEQHEKPEPKTSVLVAD